jgi:hypothetical protein
MRLWIARNKSGALVLWFNKPVKQEEGYYSNDGFFVLDSTQFPEVTFDNSPQQVEIKLVKE